jgi:hypothetical protein
VAVEEVDPELDELFQPLLHGRRLPERAHG